MEEREAGDKLCPPRNSGPCPTGGPRGAHYSGSHERKCLSADFASHCAYPARAAHSPASRPDTWDGPLGWHRPARGGDSCAWVRACLRGSAVPTRLCLETQVTAFALDPPQRRKVRARLAPPGSPAGCALPGGCFLPKARDAACCGTWPFGAFKRHLC